jgi:hypothetical protein
VPGFIAGLEHLNWLTWHDRRYRVLIDELRVPVTTQQHAEIIEPGNETLQFYSVDKKNRDRRLGLSDVIEERVLEVLRLLGCHASIRSLGRFGLFYMVFTGAPFEAFCEFISQYVASEHISRKHNVKTAFVTASRSNAPDAGPRTTERATP